MGNGNGTFQSATNFTTDAGPYSVAVANVNGDGKPDLVTRNSMGNDVSVLLGNGDGTFQAAHNFSSGSMPFAVAVADVNGDGRPDLVTPISVATRSASCSATAMAPSRPLTISPSARARTHWQRPTSTAMAAPIWSPSTWPTTR